MLSVVRMHVHVFISINCTCRVFCYAGTEASGRVLGNIRDHLIIFFAT